VYTRTRFTLVALTATLLMGLAVSSATAGRLSLSNQRFRAVWSPLRFFGEGGIEAEIRCPVTLEGSFHSATIQKVLRSLIGYVTRAISGAGRACASGSATVLAETLPWHITYEGFSGTLPRITRIRLLLRRVAFIVEPGLSIRCLYRENGTAQAAGEAIVEAGGAITGLEADRTIRLPLFSGGGFCPTEGGFEGTGTVTLQGAATRITVRLI